MAAVMKDPSYEGYYKVAWTDLAAVARGLGAEAYDVRTPADAADAMAQAITGADRGMPQVGGRELADLFPDDGLDIPLQAGVEGEAGAPDGAVQRSRQPGWTDPAHPGR